MRCRVVLSLLLAFAIPVEAETLRLSLPEAVRLALRAGTQAELARRPRSGARERAREAFGAPLPQVDARLLRYNQSINLATFGFEIPGRPPVVGPFNVTDEQLAAAMARRYLLVERAATQVSSRQADVALFEHRLAARRARRLVRRRRAAGRAGRSAYDLRRRQLQGTQMKRLRPGERAVARVDALGDRAFEGKVESLSGGTGAHLVERTAGGPGAGRVVGRGDGLYEIG